MKNTAKHLKHFRRTQSRTLRHRKESKERIAAQHRIHDEVRGNNVRSVEVPVLSPLQKIAAGYARLFAKEATKQDKPQKVMQRRGQ